jgi:hypothetical protein
MAVQVPVAVPGVFKSAGDLSTKQFHAVKVTADFTVDAAGAGEYAIGILQNKPEAADCEAGVMRLGVSKAVAGAAFVVGAKLAADAAGALVTAGSGNHVVAIALEAAGAAGEIRSVDVLPVSTPLV